MQNSFRFSQWNHLFYFLLQGIILILKCWRYFICSESIKKMSIFAWYLVLFSIFQEINADSHNNSHRLHSQALVARTTPFFLPFCLQIYFQSNFFISLLFHLFFLILTCSCQYSYNLMLTSNCINFNDRVRKVPKI
jgi:hypothetical protein